MANLGNGDESLAYLVFLEKLKANPREFILKVDNIIPLCGESCLSNMVSKLIMVTFLEG